MGQKKLKPDHLKTGKKVDNAAEGLHVFARMIARRMMEQESREKRQHLNPELPSARSDKKSGVKLPEMVDGKRAVTSSGCGGLDITVSPTGEKGSNG